MMMFGAPRRRENTVNNEKNPTIPVVTISEFKGKGTGRKITLNPMAIKALNINFDKEVLISFSFDVFAGTVLIANTSGLENMSGVRLAATSKSVSDKSYFDSIKKQFEVNTEDACELLMTKGSESFNGNDTYFLSLITAGDKMASTVGEAVAESAPEPEMESDFEPAGFPAPTESVNVDTNEAPIEEIVKQSNERDAFMATGEDVQDGEEVLIEGTEVESGEEVVVEAEVEDSVSAEDGEEEKNFFAGFDN
jgi:hypothetical protein